MVVPPVLPGRRWSAAHGDSVWLVSQHFNVGAKPGFQDKMETILSSAAIIMNSVVSN